MRREPSQEIRATHSGRRLRVRRENQGFGARLGRGNGAEKGVLGQTASFPIYWSLIDVDAAGIGGKSGTGKGGAV